MERNNIDDKINSYLKKNFVPSIIKPVLNINRIEKDIKDLLKKYDFVSIELTERIFVNEFWFKKAMIIFKKIPENDCIKKFFRKDKGFNQLSTKYFLTLGWWKIFEKDDARSPWFYLSNEKEISFEDTSILYAYIINLLRDR